jgi:hypothetical protein
MSRFFALAALLLCLPLAGCVEMMNAGGAANARADLMTYQPVAYANSGRVGPKVIGRCQGSCRIFMRRFV